MCLGRFIRKTKYILEVTDFTNSFIRFISTIRTKYEYEFYLFGSILKGNSYTDIDLLIIYSNQIELKEVKERINKEFKKDLIHLTCFTKNEELELKFIRKTKCIKIKTTHNKI